MKCPDELLAPGRQGKESTTSLFPVQSREQIDHVVRLARIIWVAHYTPLIGPRQVDYMLRTFQSVSAITKYISDGHAYYLAEDNGEPLGYMALGPPENDPGLVLSKLYVLSMARCQGIGRTLLKKAEQQCRALGKKTLWLTVNRNNTDSIGWYIRMGFTSTGPVVQDIGNGFVMDDYRMEKSIQGGLHPHPKSADARDRRPGPLSPGAY